MKKSIVWVVLLAGVITTFNSCKEDPEPIPAIVGTWSRNVYEITELPTGFTYFEGTEQEYMHPSETGYTFVFKADGTYTRSVPPFMSDKGTWTLDGTKLKVSPDDPDDLDLAESTFIGIEFDVEGEITDIRMVLSARQTICCIPSDATIETYKDNPENIPDEDYKEVDATILYKFDRLN
jgi:hypothetical protein